MVGLLISLSFYFNILCDLFTLLSGYLSPSNPYMGATIGRVANRIAKGHFKIGEYDYQLSTNIGQHHLHGGFKGFDKV